MGAWFPKDEGGMFNLEPLGKIHVSKENTQKRMPIPSCIHVFTSPHVLGRGRTFFIIHPLCFQFFLIVHAQSIIWSPLSSKHGGLFWSFSIPFCSCVMCVRPACRTMFCFGLFSYFYHPQQCKGLGSPLFAEWMSSGDHLILWERVVIYGFLSVVVQWSPLS